MFCYNLIAYISRPVDMLLSQFAAMYLLFVDVQDNVHENAFKDPFDSLLSMFVMSLGEFSNAYESFDKVKYPLVPKVCQLLRYVNY